MKQLWIDCDPGHDDALAILTAAAHPDEVNILGVSTIGGNQTLDKVTKNAQNVLSFIDARIPLVKGEERPLVKELNTAPEAHGDSGMDGPYFGDNHYPVERGHAVQHMYQSIVSAEDKVVLVGLGPLTNIALLLKSFPEIKEKIDFISIMGGGISHGNVTALAEFNIYVDPEAADIVFNSGIPVVMSGLDVTEQAEITVDEIHSLKNKGKVSHLAYQLLDFYNQSGRQFGFINSPVHDLCAVAYILKPEIFTGSKHDVEVITDDSDARGMTYIDKRRHTKQSGNTYVLTDVNRKDFVALLTEALELLDSRSEG
ncbi:nucleoside hydrolase [Corticicoccus populi]|uniref:Nucleoside hydrolase n=1 Tax=Corticicoccus populi TaxID=1812821 RepID=A0ABW5WTH1_9STAP